jgi:hypothetical protein
VVVPQAEHSAVRLADPTVVGSSVVWLILAVAFGRLLAGRASAGRQVAWLTLAGCGFLLLTVVGLLLVNGSIHGHAQSDALPTNSGGRSSRGVASRQFSILKLQFSFFNRCRAVLGAAHPQVEPSRVGCAHHNITNISTSISISVGTAHPTSEPIV